MSPEPFAAALDSALRKEWATVDAHSRGGLKLPCLADNPFISANFGTDDDLCRRGGLPFTGTPVLAGTRYFDASLTTPKTHHPDLLEVEPAQLIFFWFKGSCRDENDTAKAGRIIMNGNDDKEVRSKMAKFEDTWQVEQRNTLLAMIENLISISGGMDVWLKSRHWQRERLFDELFHQSPVQICNSVFKKIAEVVNFRYIFSGKDEKQVAWQRFTFNRFHQHCQMIFYWCIKYSNIPSGYLAVYQNWRDVYSGEVVQSLLPTLGTEDDVPVYMKMGPIKRKTFAATYDAGSSLGTFDLA